MFNAPRQSQQRYNSTNGFGNSYLDGSGPLAASNYSSYDDVDPWSSTPTLPSPQLPSAFGSILADTAVPPIYLQAYESADTGGLGDVSLNALVRVVGTSKLPASITDKIVNLVSSKPRVSRLEFYVALALVGLAQNEKDVSIEAVAYHARENNLPIPVLDLNSSAFIAQSSPAPLSPQLVGPVLDPWSTTNNTTQIIPSGYGEARTALPSNELGFPVSGTNGGPAALTGGLGKNWWKTQAKVDVSIVPERQGFILARYTAYDVHFNRGAHVNRRYSEFVYLFDCLVKRYPFRIIPSLPPKRLGGDGNFLEQRRRGLQRFLRFIVNHPVMREDGLLSVFLTEPSSLEAWRRHSAISMEEESTFKRIERVEEMSIPSDLENKVEVVRHRIPMLIEQWSRVVSIAERILRRSEASASDVSRLTMTLSALIEENPESWRTPGDEFYEGVQQGLKTMSRRLGIHSDAMERRTRASFLTSLEALKSQRDLYVATQDLFLRQERLSGDAVDKLKKRIETNSSKLESIKQAQKEGWATEADRVLSAIEMDQSAVAAALSRRIFIRHSIWHELRVVLYNRENTLITEALRDFAREERDFAGSLTSNWSALVDELEVMPLSDIS